MFSLAFLIRPWTALGAVAVFSHNHSECSNFTGMRPVFGDILINFGVVWYSGMRKWYAGFSLVVAAVGVVPGAKPCKSAGITRVYPGFGFFQVYPQNTRYFAD